MESSTSDRSRNALIVLALLAAFGCFFTACLVGGLVALGVARFATVSGQSGPLGALERVVVSRARVEARNVSHQSFDVGPGGRLVVDLEVGQVRVEAVAGDAIEVEATVVAKGSDQAEAQARLDRVRLEMAPDGSTVRVTSAVDNPVGGWRVDTPQVNVRVFVPMRTALDITVGVGDVHLEGTTGEVAVRANVGRVVLRDVTAVQRLAVRTDVAAIEFEGPLADGASYDFRSDVGRIALRLPATSRFRVEATSTVGAVTVGFDVVGESAGSLVGGSVSGVVNGGGSASVTARSEVGAIAIDSW